MEIELIERFVLDYEKLAFTIFEHSSYDISSNTIILRKFLLDPENLESLNKFLNPEESFMLNDVFFDVSPFPLEMIPQIRVFIPFFVSIEPGIRIHNYIIIDSSYLTRSSNLNLPDTKITWSSLSDFINKPSLIVSGEEFTKKDIIEFVGYIKGVIHNGAIMKKKIKLDKLKEFTFSRATGGDKRDGVVLFAPSFESDEAKRKFNNATYLALGNKHEFQSLMILEYSNYIVSSRCVEKLYMLGKKYLVKNDPKFQTFKHDHFFMNQNRLFEPIDPQNR